jgi:hypothetical protein
MAVLSNLPELLAMRRKGIPPESGSILTTRYSAYALMLVLPCDSDFNGVTSKGITVKKYLTFAAGLFTCASLMLVTAPAFARSDVSVGINIGVPGIYPAPIYVEPRPVYVEPRPIYVEPRPVYVQPPRVIYTEPRPVYIERGRGYYAAPQWEERGHRGRHWKERHHRHDRDWRD